MSSFSPQDLVYFQEVSRTRNLSRAAERLGIAQPSLTLAMKRLELHTQSPLLIRKKTGVELTHAGKIFLERSEQVLREWNELLTESRAAGSKLRGTFTLGCHQSVGQYTLPGFLPRLLSDYPEVTIRLSHGLSRHLTEAVIQHELDFGIVVNPVAHPDLRILELGRDEVTLLGISKCKNAEVLLYDPELLQCQRILERLKSNRRWFRREVHSSSLEVIARLAAGGAGVAILPRRVAAFDPALIDWKGPGGERAPRVEDRICLVYRPDSQKTRASKVLIEALRSALNSSVSVPAR